MKTIKLIDLSFLGQNSCSKFHSSKKITWNITSSKDPKETIVFTDLCLNHAKLPQYRQNIKVGWLLEPFVISPQNYQWIAQNYQYFDLILSHHENFIKDMINHGCKNIKYYPNDMCWVAEEDFQVYPKTKTCSIVASGKNWAPGHKFRHDIIRHFIAKDIGDPSFDKLDIFGYGYNPVKLKAHALSDYRFSVVIENCIEDTYYSEKLIDCFVTGTVPIFWGTDKITQTFNHNGILTFRTIADLDRILSESPENLENLYMSMLPAIEDNFIIAKDHLVAEDSFAEFL